MSTLKNFQNGVSMYRLVLYTLVAYVFVAIFLSLAGVLFFDPRAILFQTLFLVVAGQLSNKLLARAFRAETNAESAIITSLILSLVVGPLDPLSNLVPLTTFATAAMASKYVIAKNARHLLNPAAAGALFTALFAGPGASWWVGSGAMFPFVVIGGALILAKQKRFTLVGAFVFTFLGFSALMGARVPALVTASPLVFFATIMLTEPLTSPVVLRFQIIYALLVSVVSLGTAPETALLLGNIVSFVLEKPARYTLSLKQKRKLTSDTYSFIFYATPRLNFTPGQYLHWSLPHKNPDARGTRRYFTLASSPKSEDAELIVKIPPRTSSFKKALKNLNVGDLVHGLDTTGEFTLPKDENVKLALVAGGIGVTPYLSMARYTLESASRRDVVLFYTNSSKKDIFYKNVFEKAKKLGWETVYVNSDTDGRLNADMVKKYAPDHKNRLFYLSGPPPMVDAYKKMLTSLGALGIKTDYFPGYKS